MEKNDLDQLLYQSRLDPRKTIEKPPSIFYMIERSGTTTKNIPIFSKGDLSLLQGAQKTKKTWLLSSFATALLNNDIYTDMFYTECNGKVAYFDTEQSLYFAQITNQRIAKISGTEDYFYFALREYSPEQRMQIIQYFVSTHKDVEFVFIDGIVDLLYDFNDLKECSNLVQWIMQLTKKHEFHCLTILHENFADKKARGHIGSMLSQKAETVLRIEKSRHDENTSTISSKDTRGMSFSSFDLRIDQIDNVPVLKRTEEHQEVF